MNRQRDLLDSDLMEVAMMVTALAEGAAFHLQEEDETEQRWTRKGKHMFALKFLTEALEGIATNPNVHNIREFLVEYSGRRGEDWCMQWENWFRGKAEDAVMYAWAFTQGIL